MSAYGACAYDIHLYTSCYKKKSTGNCFLQVG